MSGLVKAKKYDWKDSNLAMFGSDTDKQVKKESAETEPAWNGAGQEVGLRIWRIVQFKVENWPKEDYGKFYSGDSYIILNTYKNEDEDELQYDVHFWIGEQSTQDEYGTAAYKTVELDTLLDDAPIQHREVMNHESDLFKSYFDTITLLRGGAATGFKHVTPEEYQPRLLHFHREGKKVSLKEVSLYRENLDSTDVFILDLGLHIYQWNGTDCNKDEKFNAVQYLQALKSERGGKPKVESLDERDIGTTHKFYASLSDEPRDRDEESDELQDKQLLKVSDNSGEMETSLVGEGDEVTLGALQPEDVFIVDTGKELFVWIGSQASPDENKNAMTYAHNYLMGTEHSLIPVTAMREGKETKSFKAAMTA